MLTIVAVLIGGLLTLGGVYLQSLDNDRRLKLQFEEVERQRIKKKVQAIQLDSIARLSALIDMTTEMMPGLVRAQAAGESRQFADPLVSRLSRAVVAMQALGCPIAEIDPVLDGILGFFDKASDGQTRELNAALSALEKRHNELKERAILGIEL